MINPAKLVSKFLGGAASGIVDTGLDALHFAFNAAGFISDLIFRHHVKTKLKEISEHQDEQDRLMIFRDEQRLDELDTQGYVHQIQSETENNSIDNDLKNKESESKRLQKEIDSKESLTRSDLSQIYISSKIDELTDKESDLQYEAINGSLETIDEKIDCGLALIEAQMELEDELHHKKSRKASNRIRDAKGKFISAKDTTKGLNTYLKDIQSNKVDIKNKRSELTQELVNQTKAKSEIESDKLKAEKDKLDSEVKLGRVAKINKYLTDTRLGKFFDSTKGKVKDGISKAKDYVKKNASSLLLSGATLFAIPEVARELGIAAQIIKSMLNDATESVQDKVAEAASPVIEGAKSLFGISTGNAYRDARSKGIENFFDVADDLNLSGLDLRSSVTQGKKYTQGRIAAANNWEESQVQQLAKDLGTIKKKLKTDKFKSETSASDWAKSIKLSKGEEQDVSDAILGLRSLHLINPQEYAEIISFIRSEDKEHDKNKLVKFTKMLMDRVNKLGEGIRENESYMLPMKPGVNTKGLRMGSILASHILDAYDLANEYASQLGMDPFDPLITSAVRSKGDGISKGTTHQTGTALDLRLKPANRDIKSNQEAKDRSVILGHALQKVLRDAGILEQYRIVSHGDVNGKMAPHFHLEYIGGTQRNQYGDFVDTENDINYQPVAARKDQKGHLRVQYPDPGHVDGYDASGKLYTGKSSNVNNYIHDGVDSKSDSGKEIGEPNELGSDDIKLMMQRMSILEGNLSSLIMATNVRNDDSLIYLSTPRRSIV